jgi:hypothetical protein
VLGARDADVVEGVQVVEVIEETALLSSTSVD